ncbi:hypothetical protein D3C76_1617740 [compost metagenome]
MHLSQHCPLDNPLPVSPDRMERQRGIHCTEYGFSHRNPCQNTVLLHMDDALAFPVLGDGSQRGNISGADILVQP